MGEIFNVDTQLLPVAPPEVGSSEPDPNKLPTYAKVAIVAALVLGSAMLGLAAFLIRQIFVALSNFHL